MNSENRIDKAKGSTILIYAAGNSDLSPYIYKQFLTNIETVKNDSSYVVTQISRAKDIYSNENKSDSWSGCHRYSIENNKAMLLEDLGNINMADPKTLRDFLIWGINTFPAERIVLILSGHSAGFVGLMKEYSQKGTSFMGIRGFIRALKETKEATHRVIDLMIMDTCFMEAMEIWYEVAIKLDDTVRYVFIPKENAPISGLPCNELINVINQQPQTINDIKMIKNIINHQSDLFCVKLSRIYFNKLNSLLNEVMAINLKENDNFIEQLLKNRFVESKKIYISIPQLLDNLHMNYPKIEENKKQILNTLKEIVFCANNEFSKNTGLTLYLPYNSTVYHKYKKIYHKMLFCNHNIWPVLLKEMYYQ